jgi:hypothetical protein
VSGAGEGSAAAVFALCTIGGGLNAYRVPTIAAREAALLGGIRVMPTRAGPD